MNNIWKKYEEIWVVLVFLAILLAVFFLAVLPLDRKIKKEREYSEQKNIEKEIAENKLEKMSEFRSDLNLIESQDGFSAVFFQSESAVALIEKIEKLAGETDNQVAIKIISERRDSESDPEGRRKKDESDFEKNFFKADFLEMQISLEGNFINIMKFISRLENIDYFSDLTSLKLDSAELEQRGASDLQSGGIFHSISFPADQASSSTKLLPESVGLSQENQEADNVAKEGDLIKAELEVRFYLQKNN